jgi:MFS family permease
VAILADALSFYASALLLRNLPRRDSDAPKLKSAGASWRSIWADAREGLEMILRHPVLRSVAFSLMAWNILKHAYIAIAILYATRDLGLSPGTIGTLYMLAGIGFLVASASCQPLNQRFGVGQVMLAGLTLTAVSWLMIAGIEASRWAVALLGLSLFVLDLGVMLFFINYLSLRQAATPEHLRGRVTSTLIFIAVSLAPLGSLLGGAMGGWIGLRQTIGLCGVTGLLLGILLFWKSPLAAMRELPTAPSRIIPEQPEMTA